MVALLTEGVDRNEAARSAITGKITSPSSRRAWIEIQFAGHKIRLRHVALLTEGVDRNTSGYITCGILDASPSSRRAWIEICVPGSCCRRKRGSPSSRRAWIEMP